MRSSQILRVLSISALAVSVAAIASVNAATSTSTEATLRIADDNSKGIVTGVVKDKDGNPMANQVVRLHKPDPNAKPEAPANRGALPGDAEYRAGPGRQIARATSDSSGKFEFKDVPAGTYNLVATKPGMGFAKKEGVTVTAGQTTTTDLNFK